MTKIKTEMISLKVSDGTSMNAYAAFPDDNNKYPGLLLFQEAFGVNGHIKDLTERFSREGYVVISPELFHRTEPGFQGSYTDFSATKQHIQVFWGGLDKHLGKDQIDAVTSKLAEYGKEYTNVLFSKADHGFFCDARVSYNPFAAKQAWALTNAFFNLHLKV